MLECGTRTKTMTGKNSSSNGRIVVSSQLQSMPVEVVPVNTGIVCQEGRRLAQKEDEEFEEQNNRHAADEENKREAKSVGDKKNETD